MLTFVGPLNKEGTVLFILSYRALAVAILTVSEIYYEKYCGANYNVKQVIKRHCFNHSMTVVRHAMIFASK